MAIMLHQLESGIFDELNYHINVVFRKFAYSLMSRVTASPNSIVSAIVNNDAYHQSPLMDKWMSMLYV